MLREIYEQNARALDGGRVKLSVVIPRTTRRARSGRPSSASPTPRGNEIDYEIARGRRRERRTHARGHPADSAPQPTVSCVRSPYPRFRLRRARRARRFDGDAVAIVMADASDDPEDIVTYYRLLEAGYDCAFGSRFMRGGEVDDYPRVKLVAQPDRQLRHQVSLPPRLQRHDERVQGATAAK